MIQEKQFEIISENRRLRKKCGWIFFEKVAKQETFKISLRFVFHIYNYEKFL